MVQIRGDHQSALARPDWKGETGRVDDLVRKHTDQWGLSPTPPTAYLWRASDHVRKRTGHPPARRLAEEFHV
jgi:hypothetical protein